MEDEIKDNKSYRLNWVDISQFKSIEFLKLESCKRINFFIGKPNVGKSNIIEALALLGGPIKDTEGNLPFMIRRDMPSDLFFNQRTDKPIVLNSNILYAKFKDYQKERKYEYIIGSYDSLSSLQSLRGKSEKEIAQVVNSSLNEEKGEILNLPFKSMWHFNYPEKERYENIVSAYDSLIRNYHFNGFPKEMQNYWNDYLLPDASNFLSIYRQNSLLQNEVKSLVNQSGLEPTYVLTENKFFLSKKESGGIMLFSLNATADTFQRQLYYLAAIYSNNNGILLFEEPEAHQYTPYVMDLGHAIQLSENNQFFITTHNNYLIKSTMRDMEDFSDLNIYIVYTKDGRTKVKPLTEQQITEIYNDDIDIALNVEAYIPNE